MGVVKFCFDNRRSSNMAATAVFKRALLQPGSAVRVSSCLSSSVAAPSARPDVPDVKKGDQTSSLTFKWNKLCYNWAQMNQLGMKKDDYKLIPDGPEGEFLERAIRRLPPEERDQRTWRRVRAHYLQCQKKVLPEEDWVKYEDDLPEDSYLQPYIDELRAEEEEKKKWAALK